MKISEITGGAPNTKSRWSSETRQVNSLLGASTKKKKEADARQSFDPPELNSRLRNQAADLKKQGQALRARHKKKKATVALNKAQADLMKFTD